MPMLSWGNFGERYFESGIDRGVLFLEGQDGVAWNGLISVNETPSGGVAKAYYMDGIKYENRASAEEYEASIEAYMYPPEFAQCDGTVELFQAQGLFTTQQSRKSFDLAYRTKIGSDAKGIDEGYKIHLVYNALATPADKNYKAIGDSLDPSTFTWKISTTPIPIQNGMYGAHLVIDTREAYPWVIEKIEKMLYGSEDTPSTMPRPDELLALFIDNALLKITDNGDGTWTAEGPDSIVSMLTYGAAMTEVSTDLGTYLVNSTLVSEDSTDPGTYVNTADGLTTAPDDPGVYFNDPYYDKFQINWPSAVYLDPTTYQVSSL